MGSHHVNTKTPPRHLTGTTMGFWSRLRAQAGREFTTAKELGFCFKLLPPGPRNLCLVFAGRARWFACHSRADARVSWDTSDETANPLHQAPHLSGAVCGSVPTWSCLCRMAMRPSWLRLHGFPTRTLDLGCLCRAWGPLPRDNTTMFHCRAAHDQAGRNRFSFWRLHGRVDRISKCCLHCLIVCLSFVEREGIAGAVPCSGGWVLRVQGTALSAGFEVYARGSVFQIWYKAQALSALSSNSAHLLDRMLI